jgi:peptide chain release factor 1
LPRGWTTEILSAADSDLGGYKDVQVAVKSRGAVGPDEGVYARLHQAQFREGAEGEAA